MYCRGNPIKYSDPSGYEAENEDSSYYLALDSDPREDQKNYWRGGGGSASGSSSGENLEFRANWQKYHSGSNVSELKFGEYQPLTPQVTRNMLMRGNRGVFAGKGSKSNTPIDDKAYLKHLKDTYGGNENNYSLNKTKMLQDENGFYQIHFVKYNDTILQQERKRVDFYDR